VITDAHGRWQLDNVPPDKVLVFDPPLAQNRLDLRIALRLSHLDYVNDKVWGGLQQEQGVTHESLRDQTATIVMKARNPKPKDQ
jgi:hypothetical protein